MALLMAKGPAISQRTKAIFARQRFSKKQFRQPVKKSSEREGYAEKQ